MIAGDFAPLDGGYGEDLHQLVYKLLSPDPNERPTCSEIFDIPFVVEYIEDCGGTIEIEKEGYLRHELRQVIGGDFALTLPNDMNGSPAGSRDDDWSSFKSAFQST